MYMQTRKPKIRITQTLLSSWLYTFKTESGYEKFLATLNREKIQPTIEMLNGNKYENILNNVLDGEIIQEDHEWYSPITQMAEELKGAQKQVTIFKDIIVDGQPILLHGVLDFLVRGHIYDCKFSEAYGKEAPRNSPKTALRYFGSPQHPMYLSLVPEARDFIYIICDNQFVYHERYTRQEIVPIEETIKCFLDYLKMHNLFDIYEEKWRVKNG